MHRETIQRANEQFLKFPLFECLYVSSSTNEATYALSKAGVVDFNDVVWFRSVDVLTGEVTREGSALDNEYAQLLQVIRAHYSADYIKREGIVLSMEFAQLAENYVRDGKNVMHKHVVFGQSIYYADVDELTGETIDGQEFAVGRN